MEKNFKLIIIGLIVFIVGVICLNIELSSYSIKNEVPVKIKENEIEFSMKYDSEKDYRFIRGKNNQNIVINKNEDNTLKDDIVVKVKYLDTSKLGYDVQYNAKYTNIYFINSLNLNTNNIHHVADLLLKCIKDKTIYNYVSIKYSKVEIYANKDIIKELEVINYEDINR